MYCRIITIFSLFICMLVSLTACKMRTRVVDVQIIQSVDTTVYAILPYDTLTMSGMNWHYNNVEPGVLTPAGVDSLEVIVDSAYTAFTKNSINYLHKLMPLYKYRRQYVPVATAKGDRVVWVNFFCDDFGLEWRKQVLTVKDGGVCYFQLFIDINHRKAYELIPNDYAFLPAGFRTLL